MLMTLIGDNCQCILSYNTTWKSYVVNRLNRLAPLLITLSAWFPLI